MVPKFRNPNRTLNPNRTCLFLFLSEFESIKVEVDEIVFPRFHNATLSNLGEIHRGISRISKNLQPGWSREVEKSLAKNTNLKHTFQVHRRKFVSRPVIWGVIFQLM